MNDELVDWVISFAMAALVVGLSLFAFAFVAWELFSK